MEKIRQFSFKRFGYLDFEQNISSETAGMELDGYIKIAFIRAGGKVTIDFDEYHLAQDAFFFINAGQFYKIDDTCCGTILFYNRDFYCVEIHDKEVACDGILFHNVYEVPVVKLDQTSSEQFQSLLLQIRLELETDETGTEEMLRILLKQIIIKCTRLWKQAHSLSGEKAKPEVEFSRNFSQLVEKHYTRHHTVADYAGMLNMSPKALNKRITRDGRRTTPNDVIKNRIILEAKRLLVHTNLSIKEIGYKLGYEDTSYFTRFFTRQASMSPQSFRKEYQFAQR